jgi:hypothetical protein
LYVWGTDMWWSFKNHVKHYYCTHIPCNLICDLFSTFLLLNVFWLAITKGMNIYSLKTFQLFIFNSFVKFYKHNSTLTLWDIVCRPVKTNLNLIHFKFSLQHNKMWKKQEVCLSVIMFRPPDHTARQNPSCG